MLLRHGYHDLASPLSSARFYTTSRARAICSRRSSGTCATCRPDRMRASASTTFAPLEWRHWIRCRRGEVRSWQHQERRRSHVRRFPRKSSRLNHFHDGASCLLLAPEPRFWELAGTISGTVICGRRRSRTTRSGGLPSSCRTACRPSDALRACPSAASCRGRGSRAPGNYERATFTINSTSSTTTRRTRLLPTSPA